jgi:hypothetical protein
MDATISAVAQTSLAYATDNVTSAQRQPLLCFVSPPLAAQTIAAQNLTFSIGVSQSNTISTFRVTAALSVWRPSTGALVGRIFDGPTAALSSGFAPGTTQLNLSYSISSSFVTAVTVQVGDVLVLEVWRDNTVQTMGTSYTNTLFYDGTTEASTTNNAAFFSFTNNVTLATVAPTIAVRDITWGQAGTSAWTITLPFGTIIGDLLIVVHNSSNTTPIAAPAGWTRDYSHASAAGHYCAVYTAFYSAGLTLTFPANLSTISNWMCGSYYHQDGNPIQKGDIVAFSKATQNTSLPTGAPTTGGNAGEYEVLAYGFNFDTGVTVTIAAASDSTIDRTMSWQWAPNSTVALGHNNITSLPASTTVTAFNHTLSTNCTDSDGIGILLKPPTPPGPKDVSGSASGRAVATATGLTLKVTDTYGVAVQTHPNLAAWWR